MGAMSPVAVPQRDMELGAQTPAAPHPPANISDLLAEPVSSLLSLPRLVCEVAPELLRRIQREVRLEVPRAPILTLHALAHVTQKF